MRAIALTLIYALVSIAGLTALGLTLFTALDWAGRAFGAWRDGE